MSDGPHDHALPPPGTPGPLQLAFLDLERALDLTERLTGSLRAAKLQLEAAIRQTQLDKAMRDHKEN